VDFLRALLGRNIQDAVLGGIADAVVTNACYEAGVGSEVNLSLGASLDVSSSSIQMTGKVLFLADTRDENERIAVLKTEGITIIMSHKRRPFHYEADFLRLGIKLQDYKMIIVKVGYLVPDLKRIANGIYLALSPGVVDQAIERLSFESIKRPTYPLDKNFSWSPT